MFDFIIQSLLCCCDFFAAIMLFQHFLLDKWETSVGNIILKMVSICICGLILTCINVLGIYWLNVIATIILNFIVAFSFYKGKLFVSFFLSILVAALSVFLEVFVVNVTSWIFEDNITNTIGGFITIKFAMTIISKILLFTIVWVLFIFINGRKYVKASKESLALFILPVVTIVNIIFIVKLEFYVPATPGQKIVMSLVCFGLILCNIAVFFVYDRNLHKYELENQLREMERMQCVQADYYKQIQKGLNESRKQLHDFKNHITALERLYHTDDKDKVLNYIQELQDQMNEQMDASSFGVNNSAFDVILYEQERICRENGITFEKQILYNDLSVLTYMDTCTIFANALDNAVRACKDIINQEKKVSLYIKRSGDLLNIIIENTKQNQIICQNKKLISTKKDTKNHGFGVENVKRTVEKYKGIVNIDYTDTLFMLAITIPAEKEQK